MWQMLREKNEIEQFNTVMGNSDGIIYIQDEISRFLIKLRLIILSSGAVAGGHCYFCQDFCDQVFYLYYPVYTTLPEIWDIWRSLRPRDCQRLFA